VLGAGHSETSNFYYEVGPSSVYYSHPTPACIFMAPVLTLEPLFLHCDLLSCALGPAQHLAMHGCV
jgi:hypothetical protein